VPRRDIKIIVFDEMANLINGKLQKRKYSITDFQPKDGDFQIIIVFHGFRSDEMIDSPEAPVE